MEEGGIMYLVSMEMELERSSAKRSMILLYCLYLKSIMKMLLKAETGSDDSVPC